MKVALFSESEADDAALRVFVEAILGEPIEPVPHVGLRTRGWPSVRNILEVVLKQLHYHREAEGFVMIVDSNGTPPHVREHEGPNPPKTLCRLCRLRAIRDEVFKHARPRLHRAPLKTAMGLAVPAIEAWLLCGQDHGVNEAVWKNGLAAGHPPYSTRELKTKLYGTDRPSLALESRRMTEAARGLANQLAHVERCFPDGFGGFAQELRLWH